MQPRSCDHAHRTEISARNDRPKSSRPRRRCRRVQFEALESRWLLASDAIDYSSDSRVITIDGTSRDDDVTVREVSNNQIEVSFRNGSEDGSERFDADRVRRIVFYGRGGDDEFTNDTSIDSYAEGGDGNDVLRGGSGDDELRGDDDEDELDGNDGDDLLRGGDDDDRLMGGDGDDELRGERGRDRLYGDDDDDRLIGGDHEDRLYGGDGNDVLEGGAATDRMYGDGGDDEMYGGDGDDRMYGHEGNDVLYGEAGVDYLFGGSGNDDLNGGADYDRLYGDVGNDILRGDDGDDRLYGEAGDDRLYGGDGEDKVYGMDGVDVLYGGRSIDGLYGGLGDDRLFGEEGEDRLYGEEGHDYLEGGDDNDKIYAGDGDDEIYGNDGDDRIYGDDGDDNIDAGRDDDTVYGGNGHDRIELGEGRDKVFAGDGDDVITGGPGEDKIFGEAGDDVVDAESDDDVVRGGSGNDVIRGGEGNDDLRGESGDDIVIGGVGRDDMRGDDDRDLLIGGAERDQLEGDQGDDILIGGRTSYDDDDDALWEVMDAWTSSDSYSRRVSTLEDDDFEFALRTGYTVFDDLQIDQLNGRGEQDWYFQTGVLPGIGSYGGVHAQSGHTATSAELPPELDEQPDDLTIYDVFKNRDDYELEDGEQLHTLLPHPHNPTRQRTHAAFLALVDVRDVTHRAVRDGEWSDSNTWLDRRIPGDGARVWIPFGTTVTIDRRLQPELKTVRVDGLLRFATNADTELRVDTVAVSPSGRLEMGTESDPIDDDETARILIVDDGRIDRSWDPLALSRGILVHGSIEIHGAERTSYVALDRAPAAGDEVLYLDETPRNWQVGDTIVIAGTDFDRDDHEEREILAIDASRRTVRVQALNYNHSTPRDELEVHVANVTRNAVIESENDDLDRRGHVMFMHTDDVDIYNAGFYSLGRTDKLSDINDPKVDDDGRLISGTGTNPRGRYSIHFHRGGVVDDGDPGVISGVAVTDSPGWGIAVHSSFADVEDSVVFDSAGSAFVTEAGDEIGSFRRNIAIYTAGSGEGITDRSDKQDFAHQGVGFWLQGSGMIVEDNIATGHAAQGYLFYSRGLEEPDLGGAEPLFPSANLDVSSIADGRDAVPVSDVPITTFNDNVAYDSIEGVNLRYHLEKAEHDKYGKIRNVTLWNNETGMNVYYSRNLEVNGITIVTNVNEFDGTGLDHNDASENLVYRNVFIEGYFVGVDLPRGGDNVIDGGTFRNSNNIAIVSAERERTILIRDVEFRHIDGFNSHKDIWMISRFGGDDLWALESDRITIDYGRFSNARLFFREQHPDFVPFPRRDDDIPPEYIGKTNEELWDDYRVAVGGAVATDDDGRASDLIDGLIDD